MKKAETLTTWDLQILHQKERAYQGQPTSLKIWLHLEITWPACQSATNRGLVHFCFVPRLTGRFSRTGTRVANCSINKFVSGRLIASSGTLDGDDTAIGTFDHRLRRTFDHRGLFWMCPHLVKVSYWTLVFQVKEHVIAIKTRPMVRRPFSRSSYPSAIF